MMASSKRTVLPLPVGADYAKLRVKSNGELSRREIFVPLMTYEVVSEGI